MSGTNETGGLLSRYCPRTEFESYEDFYENYRCEAPENFNFAYDVVDEWARLEPEKAALLWTNDGGEMLSYTFAGMKELSDRTANVLRSQGIVKGDVVMLILKQRPEVWVMMTALEKIGAVCIPATYQLTQKDLVYRCNAAEVKMLVSVDEPELLENIRGALPQCRSLRCAAAVGSAVPGDFLDLRKAAAGASPVFERPRGGGETKLREPMLI
ncbi:MAG: AMP-binding protein, partial [Treponema sp.]|nr:AMP-binding protein [Treponema sp.]